ncbi:6-carboxy-5,6,7,8-tetrahydropterin synthase [mine drainage metagenome]|uniref:6-carboxy-5,6,7,8-tetrahydropterin synthase n=1 Tax=mine drainage metagenome TaxID=410659 RepID=A0A1J5PV68_9ZZZZ
MLAALDNVMGWTLDFGDVKTLFDPIFKTLDHHPIHEVAGIDDCDSASIARWIHQQAHLLLPQLSRVDLYQSEGCGSIVTLHPGGPAMPV